MQKVAVIGLGRFGMAVARRLAAAGAEVIAVDRDRKLVEKIKDEKKRQERRQQAERDYRDPALGYLALSRGVEVEAPVYPLCHWVIMAGHPTKQMQMAPCKRVISPEGMCVIQALIFEQANFAAGYLHNPSMIWL